MKHKFIQISLNLSGRVSEMNFHYQKEERCENIGFKCVIISKKHPLFLSSELLDQFHLTKVIIKLQVKPKRDKGKTHYLKNRNTWKIFQLIIHNFLYHYAFLNPNFTSVTCILHTIWNGSHYHLTPSTKFLMYLYF